MFGVTKIIKKAFAPHFKFKNLLQVPKNKGGLKKRAACKRGKRLDYELQQTVVSKSASVAGFCKESVIVLEKLNQLGLRLTQSQVYVSDQSLKLCAFVDLIAFNETNKKEVVIEVKRGCHYKKCSTLDGYLRFQHAGVTDCLENQHQMQALLNKILYEKKTGATCDCCLIYVDEEHCEVIPESDFVVSVSPESLLAIQKLKVSKKRKQK